jgi:hypothetical protein
MIVGVICVFLLSCSERIPEGKTDKWTSYDISKYGKSYYDKNDMTYVKPKLIRVWTKIKYSKYYKEQIIQMRKDNEESIYGWDKLDYGITLEEVDCMNNTIKTMTNIYYNERGEILDKFDTRDPEIVQIPIGSISDSLRRIVCPK